MKGYILLDGFSDRQPNREPARRSRVPVPPRQVPVFPALIVLILSALLALSIVGNVVLATMKH